jgi:hypothetical protein
MTRGLYAILNVGNKPLGSKDMRITREQATTKRIDANFWTSFSDTIRSIISYTSDLKAFRDNKGDQQTTASTVKSTHKANKVDLADFLAKLKEVQAMVTDIGLKQPGPSQKPKI